MSQEFNILRCYSCNIFQVHIVTKANKWQCKVCNETQSIQYVYHRGCSQDCRLQVQHLNSKKPPNEQMELDSCHDAEFLGEAQNSASTVAETRQRPVVTRSKWTKYISEPGTNDYDETGLMSSNTIEQFKDSKALRAWISQTPLDTEFVDLEKETKNLSPCTDVTVKHLVGAKSTNDSREASICDKGSFRKNDISFRQSTKTTGTSASGYMNERNADSTEATDSKKRFTSLMRTNEHYVHDLFERKASSKVLQKPVKRKWQMENSLSKPDISSNDGAGVAKIFVSDSAKECYKRPKITENEATVRKQSLSDLVKTQSSNDGKHLQAANGKFVLKDMNDVDLPVNRPPTSKFDVKRKSIFETDCENLDEILDF